MWRPLQVVKYKKMVNKVIIDTERCKGCGLCIEICPKKHIRLAIKSNKKGYFPAETSGGECTGCAMCAIVCSETIIEVYRDCSRIKAVESRKKFEPNLIREKA